MSKKLEKQQTPNKDIATLNEGSNKSKEKEIIDPPSVLIEPP